MCVRRLAVALVSIALAVPAPAHALPPAKDTWLRIDSEHFTLYGDVQERRLRSVAVRLERFREVLSRITRGLSSGASAPTSVYVFRSPERFRPYVPGGVPSDGGITGFYQPSDDGDYVGVNGFAEIGRPVYWSYVLDVLKDNLPDAPLWLRIGLAELYSTFQYDDAHNRAELGHPIAHHLEQLRLGLEVPFDRLLAADRSSPEFTNPVRRRTFDAEAWALTHYLVVGNDERRAALMTYLARLKAGGDADAALRAALGGDLDALRSSLQRYVHGPALSHFWFKFDTPVEDASFRVATLSRAEALYRLGDLLAHEVPTPWDDAEEHLRTALELRPDLVPAKLGYGETLLRRFVAEHPDGVSPDAPTAEPLLRARALLREGIAEAPEDVAALAALGETFVLSGDEPAEGIAALSRASQIRPDRLDLTVDFVRLLARSGRTAVAWNVIETGLRRRDAEPDDVAVAEGAVVAAEIERADRAVADGKVADADAILGAALDRARDEAARSRLEAKRAELAQSQR